MASAVDICNLALANLGDTATVASLDPPEGSAQAEHCARFYPIARDILLEMNPWNFATRRISLALLADTVAPWAYAYAMPNNCKGIISVLPPEAADDYSANLSASDAYGYSPQLLPTAISYTPQPYCVETLSTGVQVILTNQEDAVLRYTVGVTDTTKFSATFVMALSHLLASMLAGPVLKGDVGKAEAKAQLAIAKGYVSQAASGDANEREIKPAHAVAWMAGR